MNHCPQCGTKLIKYQCLKCGWYMNPEDADEFIELEEIRQRNLKELNELILKGEKNNA